MQADRLGEEPGADGGEQDEGKAFAARGAERQFEARVDDRADESRDGEETDDLAQCDEDADGLEGATR